MVHLSRGVYKIIILRLDLPKVSIMLIENLIINHINNYRSIFFSISLSNTINLTRGEAYG